MDAIVPEPRIALMQSMPIFGGLDGGTLRFLLGLTTVVRRRKGERFYNEGDPAQSVYVLESGKVGMFKRWKDHDRQINTLRRGDCFGEVALIDLGPRHTTTIALEDSSALELTAQDLYRLYEHDVEQFAVVYMNMGREICRRLREADQRAFECDMVEGRPG